MFKDAKIDLWLQEKLIQHKQQNYYFLIYVED